MALDISKTCDIRDDSRHVKKGDIFVAVKGDSSDGHDFIDGAIKKGAAIIVHDKNYTPKTAQGVQFHPTSDGRLFLTELCAKKYQPIPEILVGITGTSGKSSVVEFLRQFWAADNLSAATMGTLGVRCGDLKIPSTKDGNALTSMPTVALHKMLQKLAELSVSHVAIEASSHGLMQKRLHGLKFSAAAFTNLSRDHLDYHKNLDDYFQAKMILFSELLASQAAVFGFADSDRFPQLQEICGKHKLYSYGSTGDIALLNLQESSQGMIMDVNFFGKKYQVSVPLIGGFQALNLLLAGGIAHVLGVSADKVFAAIPSIEGISGRMQKIRCDFGTVVVDYAHKPEALRMALQSLRPYASGELIALFGCGGDRDKGKRAQMGKISAELADFSIITDDNPRSEDSKVIRKAIIKGVGSSDYVEIGDRASAIAAGMDRLKKHAGSVLLIAGKGHESGQIIGDNILAFDDAEIAKTLAKG